MTTIVGGKSKSSKSTKNNIVLKNVNIDLSDSYMLIEYDNEAPLTKYSKILLHRFMTIINSRIGSRTNLNYHIQPVENFTIRIPFYIYTNDEKKLDTYSFIEKRVNTLISFLSNLDWSNCANLQELWIIP